MLKKIFGIILISVVALFFVGCVSNTSVNSNTKSEITAEQKKQIEEEKKAKLEAALKNVKTEKDEIKEITWYKGITLEDVDYTGLMPYVGTKKEKVFDTENVDVTWMRFYVAYEGKDWIFFDRLYFKTDKNTYEIPVQFRERQTKVLYGSVAEWYDVKVDKKLYDMLVDIANSDKVLMRYEGQQNSKDRTITDKEKQNIKNMLDIFNGLGGTIKEK